MKEYDFDHPQALDFNEAYNVLSDLLKGKKATLPRYSFVTHQRLKEVDVIAPTEIIMFEGILALYDARIRALMKYKIFIHCDGNPLRFTQTTFACAAGSCVTCRNEVVRSRVSCSSTISS